MTTNTRNGSATAWTLHREPPKVASSAPPHDEVLAAEIGAEVAHGLKNSLAGMKALVQLGLRNPAESPSHARLALIEKEIARMQEIVIRYFSAAHGRAASSPRSP